MSPPKRACEELEGSPNSHVRRFQRIPPTRPQKTIRSSMWFLPSPGPMLTLSRLTMPLATVAATSTERNAPTRLSAADKPTATFGFSAPVAMDAAIALPVSWNPLVKSNAKAVTTTTQRVNNSGLTELIIVYRTSIHNVVHPLFSQVIYLI